MCLNLSEQLYTIITVRFCHNKDINFWVIPKILSFFVPSTLRTGRQKCLGPWKGPVNGSQICFADFKACACFLFCMNTSPFLPIIICPTGGGAIDDLSCTLFIIHLFSLAGNIVLSWLRQFSLHYYFGHKSLLASFLLHLHFMHFI